MKIFLTLLNIALIGIVIWRVSGFFKSSGEEEFTVGRDRAVSTETATKVTAPAATPMSVSEAGTLVTRYNLFNLTRCPDAVAGRGASRPQMTLLGIYKIGNSQGAIIQQRTQQRGPVRAGTNQQQAEKLYFQVGEVMSNGYTVAAIDSGKVTLSRSGSTLELPLETAGRNINTTGQTQTNRQPNAQQIQQMMMMGQMRMMGQMMNQQNRLMQQQMQQQQQQQQQGRQGQVPARNTGTAAARGR